jgi:hypothetical protein
LICISPMAVDGGPCSAGMDMHDDASMMYRIQTFRQDGIEINEGIMNFRILWTIPGSPRVRYTPSVAEAWKMVYGVATERCQTRRVGKCCKRSIAPLPRTYV